MTAGATYTPQAQADALIAEIRRKTAQAARAAQEAALREAQEILQGARAKARRQLQRARADLRQARMSRLAQVNAQLEAQARGRAAARARQLLAQAWPLLEDALERRWGSAGARASWVAAALDLARARLGAGDWRVGFPADLDPAAITQLRAALEQRGVSLAKLDPDTRLRAGLVVECGGVRVDATPRALLVDRYAVEGALLAAVARGEAR